MNFDEKVAQSVLAKNEATDTTCFIAFYPSATGAVKPKTNAGLSFNSATAVITAGGFITAGSVRADGYLGVGKAPTVAIDIQGTTTASSSFSLYNTTANSFLQNTLRTGTTRFYQYSFGQSYSTSGRYMAASVLLDASGVNGLGLSTYSDDANAKIRFWTGSGNDVRADINKDGLFTTYAACADIPDEITATSEGVAASLVTKNTEVTTNGDSDLDNVTLANGTSGQIKCIYCVVEGNAADTWKITPATMCNGTQITFSGAGEGCTLKYVDNEGWVVVGNNGGTIT